MALTSGLNLNQFGDSNVSWHKSPTLASEKSASNRAVAFEVFGIGELIANLGLAVQEAKRIAGVSLAGSAVAIMELAIEKYVPVETGALRDSGWVKPPKNGPGDEVYVEFGFGPSKAERNRRLPTKAGRSGSEYAVPVHEMPNLAHQFGSWKYLWLPYLERQDQVMQKLRENFGGV